MILKRKIPKLVNVSVKTAMVQRVKKPEDLVMTTLHSGQEAALCTARLYMETAMIPILFTCLVGFGDTTCALV